jgi:hypothetical protein
MGKFTSILTKSDPLILYDIELHIALKKEREQAQAERKHLFHASLLDEEDDYCARRALMNMVQAQPKSISLTQMLRFKDGDARHVKWQTLHKKAGLSKGDQENTRLLPGLMMLLTPDDVVWLNKEPYVWEAKGMADRLWKVALKNPLVAPKKFTKRMHLYFLGTSIYKGILLIDNKDTNQYHTYLIEADMELMQLLVDRAAELARWYRKWKKYETLPPRCGLKTCEVCYPKERNGTRKRRPPP